MSSVGEGFLRGKLEGRIRDGNLRQLSPLSTLADFTSNDYFGLAADPALRRTWREDPEGEESGAGGSRLLSGNHPIHEQLEGEISDWSLAESALTFSSGYLANTGLLSALAERHSVFYYDRSVHTSLKDGMRTGQAAAFPFLHNDMDDLRRRLRRRPAAADTWIVTESLFSMDGDFAPLLELVSIADEFSAGLIVDEAHAGGIRGNRGAGRCEELGLQDRVFARIFTFGKALGAQGAAVAGSSALRDFLINFSRPFIYSTALFPPLARFVLHSLRRMRRDLVPLQAALEKNLSLFNDLTARAAGKKFPSPIISWPVPGNREARELAEKIRSSGYDVRAILSPTVPAGTERLRIILHSFQKEEDIRGLCDLLAAESLTRSRHAP